jgi:hypothetical protein
MFANAFAVTQRAETAEIVATAAFGEPALRLIGRQGGDVDDAIDGIGAPQRSAGTADDFDAVQIGQQHILRVPKHACVERCVNRTAVDEHQ